MRAARRSCRRGPRRRRGRRDQRRAGYGTRPGRRISTPKRGSAAGLATTRPFSNDRQQTPRAGLDRFRAQAWPTNVGSNGCMYLGGAGGAKWFNDCSAYGYLCEVVDGRRRRPAAAAAAPAAAGAAAAAPLPPLTPCSGRRLRLYALPPGHERSRQPLARRRVFGDWPAVKRANPAPLSVPRRNPSRAWAPECSGGRASRSPRASRSSARQSSSTECHCPGGCPVAVVVWSTGGGNEAPARQECRRRPTRCAGWRRSCVRPSTVSTPSPPKDDSPPTRSVGGRPEPRVRGAAAAAARPPQLCGQPQLRRTLQKQQFPVPRVELRRRSATASARPANATAQSSELRRWPAGVCRTAIAACVRAAVAVPQRQSWAVRRAIAEPAATHAAAGGHRPVGDRRRGDVRGDAGRMVAYDAAAHLVVPANDAERRAAVAAVQASPHGDVNSFGTSRRGGATRAMKRTTAARTARVWSKWVLAGTRTAVRDSQSGRAASTTRRRRRAAIRRGTT